MRWLIAAVAAITCLDALAAVMRPPWLYGVDIPGYGTFVYRPIIEWHNRLAGIFWALALLPFTKRTLRAIPENPLRLCWTPPLAVAWFFALGIALSGGMNFSQGSGPSFLALAIGQMAAAFLFILLFYAVFLVLILEIVCLSVALLWRQRRKKL